MESKTVIIIILLLALANANADYGLEDKLEKSQAQLMECRSDI